MSNTETAQFLGTVGFIGFGMCSVYICFKTLQNGYYERGWAVLCFGMFVAMFVFISGISALGRAPFYWLDADEIIVANGLVIWAVFIATVVGLVRRD